MAGSPRAMVLLFAISLTGIVAAIVGSGDTLDLPWWSAGLIALSLGLVTTAFRAARRAIDDATWLDASDRKVWKGWFRQLGPFVIPFVAREIARHRRREG